MRMGQDRIVLLDGARTPVGSFGGAFKDVPGFELGATASKAAIERAGVDKGDIGEVVMGCIGQVGPDAYNARRVAAHQALRTTLRAGFDKVLDEPIPDRLVAAARATSRVRSENRVVVPLRPRRVRRVRRKRAAGCRTPTWPRRRRRRKRSANG